MATKQYFLLQWTTDSSLTVVNDSAIKSGQKEVGAKVKAAFGKKIYEATVVDIGEFVLFLLLQVGYLFGWTVQATANNVYMLFLKFVASFYV